MRFARDLKVAAALIAPKTSRHGQQPQPWKTRPYEKTSLNIFILVDVDLDHIRAGNNGINDRCSVSARAGPSFGTNWRHDYL